MLIVVCNTRRTIATSNEAPSFIYIFSFWVKLKFQNYLVTFKVSPSGVHILQFSSTSAEVSFEMVYSATQCKFQSVIQFHFWLILSLCSSFTFSKFIIQFKPTNDVTKPLLSTSFISILLVAFESCRIWERKVTFSSYINIMFQATERRIAWVLQL